MEREVGVGIGMGNTCKLMAVSFQCMTKSTTIKKKKRKEKKERHHDACGKDISFAITKCSATEGLNVKN